MKEPRGSLQPRSGTRQSLQPMSMAGRADRHHGPHELEKRKRGGSGDGGNEDAGLWDMRRDGRSQGKDLCFDRVASTARFKLTQRTGIFATACLSVLFHTTLHYTTRSDSDTLSLAPHFESGLFFSVLLSAACALLPAPASRPNTARVVVVSSQ